MQPRRKNVFQTCFLVVQLDRTVPLPRICCCAFMARQLFPIMFIQRERDSVLQFCPFGRVVQRGLARSFSDCVASGRVAA